MPKVSSSPAEEVVRPYQFHGVDIDLALVSGEQIAGTCPFCDRERKFYLSIKTGQWRCVVCSEGNVKGGGNLYTFLRLLWEKSSEGTSSAEHDELAANRKLMYADTLIHWGAAKSMLTGDWLLPAYAKSGSLIQLYRYVATKGRYALFATPGLPHGLYGMQFFEPSKPIAWMCEGPWDAMALWEVARLCSRDEGEGGKLRPTASESASMLSQVNVLAVPGCKVLNNSWLPLFAGKEAALLYDNDYPKPVGGGKLSRAGYDGMRFAARNLSAAEEHLKGISYLQWDTNGLEHCASLPDGYDVRDVLTAGGGTAAGRIEQLAKLLEKVRAVPKEWLVNRPGTIHSADESDCLPCTEWKTLTDSWRKSQYWHDGLDKTLSVALACILSTKQRGHEQLWIKILGPAASGKSTICEALSVNKKYVLAKSVIRGFHSGFKTDKEGTEDHSLIARLDGKTLVTKDGDTLLQSPNVSQIISEARDLYDGVSRVHYRHGLNRDYPSIRVTWILCGTSALRILDQSELGERFLDCYIMENIDEDMEDEILWRKANEADASSNYESDGHISTQHSPEQALAMQLTGGYVSWLRGNAVELLSDVKISPDDLRLCTKLGKFVAYMRARPSKKQGELAEREFGTRLTGQLVRLAKCLAVVLNRPETDDRVMLRVRQVAMDTCRGQVLELTKQLVKAGKQGLEKGGMATLINQTEEHTGTLVRFLRRLGAIESFRIVLAHGVRSRVRWKLTSRLAKLYRDLHEKSNEE